MAYLIICPTCHRQVPVKNKYAKYCTMDCYLGRPSPSVPHKLIRALGGSQFLADYLKCSQRSVRAWAEQGIPRKYYIRLVHLAIKKGVAGVTFEWLEHISAEQRATWRAQKKAGIAAMEGVDPEAAIEDASEGMPDALVQHTGDHVSV